MDRADGTPRCWLNYPGLKSGATISIGPMALGKINNEKEA